MKNVKVLLMLMLLFVLNANSQQTPTSFLMPAYASETDNGEEPILDFTKIVGTINGEYGVNDNGAAVYSIPILIPPGSGGMVPTVGIQYNSQSGDGWLGKGWTVSGFSSITRMPKTFYLDNKVEGLKFNNTDHFVLDGNVLIPISGNNGENGTEYRTEVETFSQIISYCTTGSNEPDYFVVHTKDGKIIQYGNTTDSRQMLPGSIKNTLAWHANKISDANTNFIVFSYTNENSIGRFKPCEIKYTGNDSPPYTAPYNSIHFFYKSDYPNDNTDLPKDRISYIYGTKLSQIEILDYIEIKNKNDENNWELVRRYTFDYYNSDANDFKTLLKSITEWDSQAPDAANSYNPTVFNYTTRGSYGFGYLSSLYSFTPANGNWHANNPRYMADVNGDGRDDIVGFGNTDVYVSLSNGQGYDSPTPWLLNNFCVNSGGWNIEPHPRKLADVNGDGMVDIVGFGHQNLVVALSTGTSFNITSSLAWFCPASGDYENDAENPRFIVDVNGDKLPDIVGFANNKVEVAINTGTGFVLTPQWDMGFWGSIGGNWVYPPYSIPIPYFPFEFHPDNPNQLVRDMADVNGDGMADIIGFGHNDVYVSLSTGTGFAPPVSWLSGNYCYDVSAGSWDKNSTPRYVQDVNGDGMADIVGFGHSNVTVALSNGLNQFIPQGTSWHEEFDTDIGYSNNKDFPRYLADVNGDGLPDIVGFGHPGVGIGVNTGHSFISAGGISGFGADDGWISVDHIRTLADVNGDGRADIVGFGHDAVVTAISYLDDDRKINKITNGLGFRVQCSYQPIINNTSVYHYNGHEIYPFLKFAGSLKVVDAFSIENGIGGFSTTTYEYQDATAHLKGKGFLGFRKISTSNSDYNNSIYSAVIKDYSLNHDFCFKWLHNAQTWVNWMVASYDTYDYSITDYTNKRFFPKLDYSITTDLILNNKILKEFPPKNYPGYDEWGNIQTIKTTSYDITSGNDVEELSQLEEFIYSSAGTYSSSGNWCLNKPETIRTTKKITTDIAYVRKKKYEYNSINGNLIKETTDPYDIANPNDPNSTIVEYDYINTLTDNPDNFGNPWKKTLKAPNATNPVLPEIINKYEYDPKGRFVTKKINPLNHIVSNEYEPKYGNITRTIDENNIITDYEYDFFGSLKKIINTTEGGTYTEFGCNWITNPAQTTPAFALYQTVSTTSCEPQSPSITNYDKLTRELQTENFNINGDKIFVNKEYNDRGGIATVSLPYFEGAATSSTGFLYDTYGRKAYQYNPDNSINQFIYNGKITTVQTLKNGNSRGQASKVNSLNQTIYTVDDISIGTAVKNTYYSSGLLKNTALGIISGQGTNATVNIDPNTTSSFTYDLQGNRLSITEPNSGTTTTVYNAYGQVTSQTDANTYVTKMRYDELGRIIKKEINEGYIDYVYDVNPVTSQPQDEYCGKISSVKAHWDNGAVITEITDAFLYDPWGRKTTSRESIECNGIVIKNYEEVKGYDDENDCGRLKTLTYPDGFAIEYEYQNGQLKALNKVDAVNGNTLIWRTEAEDNMGNTTQFALGNGGYTSKSFENTTGRLLEINTSINNTPTPVPVQAWVYEYDDFGNILSRADNIPTNQSVPTFQKEDFQYDYLNRLTNINNHNTNYNYATQFDTYGNITRKFNAGDYTYLPPQINAVKEIANNPGTINTVHSVNYTSFNKVSHINENEEKFTIDFTYGPDFSRRKTYYYDNNNQTISKYFAFGKYEEEENTSTGEITKDYYIYAGDGLAAIYRKINNATTTTGSMYYIHTDILGSFDRVTNEAGNLVDQYSFDAWGNRRDVNDWEQPDPNATPHLFARGYTGHEHLDKFGLINMNGRMYDPILGRFLSPDNYVQAPDNTQNFNRYSYCLNNPMRYTDPSGEVIWLLPALISGTINLAMNLGKVNNLGDALGYFGIGAIAGGLSAGIGTGIATSMAGASFGAGFVGSSQGVAAILGSSFSSSFFSGAAIGAASGFVAGFAGGAGNAWMGGASFGDGLTAGVIGGGIGALTGGVLGGVGGGIDAASHGRNFWDGRYDSFEETINDHKYYFYSDKSDAVDKAHNLSGYKGNEVATYRIKKGFLQRYTAVLDPEGNTSTSSNNYTSFINDKAYIGYSRYRILSQTHYDYLSDMHLGSADDAIYANNYNISVTHVGYYSGLRTEFIPSKWTLSNFKGFINCGNNGDLQYFTKLNSNLLRLK